MAGEGETVLVSNSRLRKSQVKSVLNMRHASSTSCLKHIITTSIRHCHLQHPLPRYLATTPSSTGFQPGSPPNLTDIRSRFKQQGHGTILLERHTAPGIATIKLQNPKRRNALSPKMQSDFADVVDELERECCDDSSSIGGVILMGDGHTFCSGFDLSQAGDAFMTPEAGYEMAALMHDTLLRLRRLPLVSVAAVDGFALGGGAELSTACDFKVMARNATIRFVQINMGVTTGFGGGTRLTKMIGRSTSLRLLLSSPTLHAQEAFALGLCDKIAEDKQVYEESVRLLNTFLYEDGGKGSARHPIDVARAMKKVVSHADELPVEESLEQEREIFKSLWGGKANMVGIKKATSKKK